MSQCCIPYKKLDNISGSSQVTFNGKTSFDGIDEIDAVDILCDELITDTIEADSIESGTVRAVEIFSENIQTQTLKVADYSFPLKDGTDTQAILTNGKGQLYFGEAGGGGGFLEATFILQTPNDQLTQAQDLKALDPGGILKSNETGVISIALGGSVPGVDDYVTPEDLKVLIDAIEALTKAVDALVLVVDAAVTTLAAVEATLVAIEATLVIATAGLAAIQVQIAALGSRISSVESTANSAARTASQALGIANNAQSDVNDLKQVQYIIATENSMVPNAQSLGALSTGFLFNTSDGTTGTLSVSEIPPVVNIYTGRAILNGTEGVVIPTINVNMNSIINVTRNFGNINIPSVTTIGNLATALIIENTSFTVYSTVAGDVGDIDWIIINP